MVNLPNSCDDILKWHFKCSILVYILKVTVHTGKGHPAKRFPEIGTIFLFFHLNVLLLNYFRNYEVHTSLSMLLKSFLVRYNIFNCLSPLNPKG